MSILIRLGVGEVIKNGIKYVAKKSKEGKAKKEEERRRRFLETYMSKVADRDEKDALIIFSTFPTDQTEAHIEKFNGQLEKRVYDEIISKKYDSLTLYYDILSKSPPKVSKSPKALEALVETRANLRFLDVLKKLQDEPEFRGRVTNHFYKINEQIKTMKEPPY